MDKWGFPLVSKEVSENIYIIKKYPNSINASKILGTYNGDSKFRCNVAQKWRNLFNTPYLISNKCCYELKKKPMTHYSKQEGRYPILGIMADESELRKIVYIKQGQCNVFGTDKRKTKSMPLSPASVFPKTQSWL